MVDMKQDQFTYDEIGKKHGEWIQYYNNGKFYYRRNWVHGVMHGLSEGYHIDGTLRYRGYRNMGRQIGYWYYFHQPNEYFLCLI